MSQTVLLKPLQDIDYGTDKMTEPIERWRLGRSVTQPLVYVTAMRISKVGGTAPQCQSAVPAVPPAARRPEYRRIRLTLRRRRALGDLFSGPYPPR